MLISLHAEALHEMLVESPVDIFDSPFSHSRLAVTTAILEDYEKVFFAAPDDKQIYLAFIQAMGARLKAVRPVSGYDDASLLRDYFSSSRAGGRYLALGSEQEICGRSSRYLRDLGVRSGTFPVLLEETANQGFRPFETHHLVHGHGGEPKPILRFFNLEDRITVYDKFINDDSVAFLNAALKVASSNCSLLILTSRRSPLTAGEIMGSITRRDAQVVSVKIVSAEIDRRIHDRHIFISSDVEMHFTRGLDSFGRPPSWTNAAGSIYIYDTSLGSSFRFSIEGSGRSIVIKSCVIK